MKKDTRGNSAGHRNAEVIFRELLKDEFGPLHSKKIDLGEKIKIEIDATNKDESVLIEIFAHQGPLNDGQKKKISKDILKLALMQVDAEGGPKKRLFLAFSNDDIEKLLTGFSWTAAAMTKFGIEFRNVNLDSATRDALLADQERQGKNSERANKALQLTPSRDVPVSYDRPAFPFTSLPELVRPFGVAELGDGQILKKYIVAECSDVAPIDSLGPLCPRRRVEFGFFSVFSSFLARQR